MPICINHNQSYGMHEHCVYCGPPKQKKYRLANGANSEAAEHWMDCFRQAQQDDDDDIVRGWRINRR